MKTTKWLVISTGFALFSMFFGSGNLVFPITVGQTSEGHYLLAALGIFLTGIAVPFLGALGLMLYKGDMSHFFNCFGKKGLFLFSLTALALMGPFGVAARCLTVAHGALVLLIPNASLPIVSFLLCVVIYLLAMNKNSIVTTLGALLTPFLLMSIALISFMGFYQGSFPEATASELFQPFKNGFFQGYQTMDLLAAFFFSQFVIKHLASQVPSENSEKTIPKVFLQSALFGAGILTVVYVALVLLGWSYSPLLADVPPQEMFGIIAMAALGPLAAPVVCVAVLLACLTTAIVLCSLFAEFLSVEVCQNKINNKLALIITLGISFVVSTFDFAGIAGFLGPIIEAIYPALIVLTVYNILGCFWNAKASHWPFTLALTAKLLAI